MPNFQIVYLIRRSSIVIKLSTVDQLY